MLPPAKPLVRIVTPGTRAANNGNWRTAVRWAAMLRGPCRTIVQTEWKGEACDALIALHAKRSAGSVREFRDAHPEKRIALVLTGTDLYRDLPRSPEAARSIELADRLVVLQQDARRFLHAADRRRCSVIYQSAVSLRPAPKARDRLDVVVVGHLREEKDPETVFRALALLPRELPIRVLHIGAALDPRLGKLAERLARDDPRYRWSGALAHGLTRIAIGRAHVLVHPSILEGGANVIVEAIASGTPVIASRMSGNIGMLGARYPGFFPVGDPERLAALLEIAVRDRAWLRRLRAACARLAPLFRPPRETRAVRALAASLLP
jgi:putative glycosyltransferase (TIGR04348 family)